MPFNHYFQLMAKMGTGKGLIAPVELEAQTGAIGGW